MTSTVSLMYHNVCPPRGADGTWTGFSNLSPSVTGYFVDRATFERHCRMIVDHGRSTPIANKKPIVELTFDDGWRGTFDEAGPLLESQGLRATLFVTTDLIGHPYFVDRRQLAACPETFAIGAHGRTHRLLATLSDEEIYEELSTSKATLEEILGREVETMAFPGGSYDRRVLRIADAVGYRRLWTSEVRLDRDSQGKTPCAANGKTGRSTGSLVGRVPIKSDISDVDFRRYLSGDLRRERWRASLIAGVKRLLGRRGYSALRSRLLAEESTHLEMTDLTTDEGPFSERSLNNG